MGMHESPAAPVHAPDKAADPATKPVHALNRHQRRALASQARRGRPRGPAAVLNPLAGATRNAFVAEHQ